MSKIKREGYFTTVTNNFIRSDKISFKAKGVFIYMASFSSDWNFTIKSMASQTKDGADSIKASIQELKQLGHIKYEKHQDGSGTYFLYDSPKVEKPNVENPYKGKSTPIKKNNITKKNNTYIDFLAQLKEASKYKTKVTKTKEGEKIFKGIEDKEKLFSDYLAHQEEKREYSVRITAFMEDYKTVYESNINQEQEVTW